MTPPGVYLWRGRTYVGQRAVAEAAGVAECTVSYHLITNGHLDRLGTGKGGRGKLRPPIVKPVHMAGHSWPSIAAFARSVGMSPKTAQKAVREGRGDKLLAALMAREAATVRLRMQEVHAADRPGGRPVTSDRRIAT